MARKARPFLCNPADLLYLQELAASRSAEQRLVERAKILLALHSGKGVKETAKGLGVVETTVAKCRNRFMAHGRSGLEDEQRSGKPPTYGAAFREEVLAALGTTPPAGQSQWDGKALAARTGASPDAVWRLLRKEGICLQRQRTWCVSTDPEFASKAADIIGLYLAPPEKALVICVDEKPSIQAIERKQGYVYTSNKKIVHGLQSTYKRHGTLNLFAALNVAAGEVRHATTTNKRREDFLSFMDAIVADALPGQEMHVILDNYCTHKKNDAWLARNPNVHFHFTPTSASWLNMVEIWFGILSRKALKHASFKSTDELQQAIDAFAQAYAKTAKPCIWRKRDVKGTQLKNTIANLCN